MFNITRRTAVLGVAMAALVLSTGIGQAQAEWPSRPITWVLPVAPGGATDAMARLIQNPVSALLGQPIVIENRPGGAGVIAADVAAKAAPDGYTFAIIGSSFAANPTLLASLPYDTAADFSPVAFLLDSITAWAVPADSTIADIAGLVGVSKEKPDSISYGTGGVGQAGHFSVAHFGEVAGIELTHVPYRGAALAVTDAVAGQLPMVVATTSTAGPHVREGTLRILATASRERSAIFPDVPTLTELGYPVAISEFNAFVAPAGTDPAIVQKLNAAIREVLKRPEIAAEYRSRDLVAYDASPEELADFLREQAKVLAGIIKSAQISAE